ncbi:dipeptide epimerase [uncultured Kocuria sp.]|uniref:dipeptide epimerase n=1 Tax=uncultured Kocuria sp. TaxID=259305 RepID=UPI0025955FA3|nr:dipeptide epimerase [uncultured Kocuria sp.]
MMESTEKHLSMPAPTDGALTVRRLATVPYRGPLVRPFVTSRRRADAIDGVLVELDLDGGVRGIGSAAQTWAVTGESVASIEAAVNGPMAESLVGRTLSLHEASDVVMNSCSGNSSAKAAVDVALHDAWSAALGRPLTVALGGRSEGSVETDMTVSLGEPDVMAQDGIKAWDEGFRILKIKLGQNWHRDMERLEILREAVPQARFRLDANQGWTAQEAIRAISSLEDSGFPVDLVEQPTPKHDLEALAAVTAAVYTPIMADESIATPHDAVEIVRRGAADMLNIKLAKCGGIRAAIALADIAEAAGLGCMIGAMMEPRPSIAAAVHLAIARPSIGLVDLDSAEWIDDPRISGGYVRDGAHLTVTKETGLGIQAAGSLMEGHLA